MDDEIFYWNVVNQMLRAFHIENSENRIEENKNGAHSKSLTLANENFTPDKSSQQHNIDFSNNNILSISYLATSDLYTSGYSQTK